MSRASDPETIVLVGNRREDPTYAQRATSRAAVIHVDLHHPPPWCSPDFPIASLLLDYPNEHAALVRAVDAFTPGRRVGAVISQSEVGLICAQRLSRHYRPDLPDDLDAAVVLRDKARMRERLAQAGFSALAYRCGDDARDIALFLAQHGDIIVKPIDGEASRGVVRVRDAGDIPIAMRVARTVGPGPFLMEEYADGPEYSVETFSFEGDHRVIAFTAKTSIAGTFVEIAHVVPAPLDDQTQRQLATFVIAFLDIVGLKNGAAHTELRLTARGPRIIESQNRVGGDRIALLVKHVYGIDLLDLAFDWALRRRAPLSAIPAPRGAAAIRYFVPPAGVLRAIEGRDAVGAMPGVLEWEFAPSPGDRIPLPLSSFHRSGYVAAAGTDATAALGNAAAAGARLDLTIERAAKRAAYLVA